MTPVRALRTLRRFLAGLAWKLMLLFVLLYGVLHVGARTEWFQRRVEAELSRMLGMEMRVGRITTTETLNLKIRDVISVSEDAGLELRLVRVRWRVFRPRGAPMIESVRVDGWAVTFAPDAHGRLQPAVLSLVPAQAFGWAGLQLPRPEVSTPPASGSPTKPPDESFSRLAATAAGGIPQLEMRWGTLRLQDDQGRPLVGMTGLDILLSSMVVPEGDRITHYDVRAGTIQISDGPRIIGLHVEWIDTGDRQFLSSLDATDWGAVARPRATADDYRRLLDSIE